MTDTIEKTPTQEIVKAKFMLAIKADVFQKTLASIFSYKVTEENVLEAQEKVAEAKKYLNQIEAEKKVMKKPALDECSFIEDAFKGTHGILQAQLLRVTADIGVIAQKRAAETKRIADEKAKQEAEELAANNFFLDVSQRVAAATTALEIVSIEKQIGAHSQKPLYKEKAENFKPIISKQKEHIRALDALKEQEKKAEQSGDDEKVMQLREQQEAVEAKKFENTEAVQMAAIKTAETSSAIFPEVVGQVTVKAARTYITWEVVDMQKLYKEEPDLVVLSANTKAIDEVLRQHRQKLKDEKKEFVEFTQNGIRFFEDPRY